ncbi:hypothetical protein ACT4R9_01880 [Ornithobacterium rhinotracheale]|uniref:hypothetical protein n=1 Tax=Ornithobacterium rhinotracheale TaxID=28251 RepID=UPI003FA419B8
MSGTIKFFHPEETFVYQVDKSFCKVVYLRKKNCLVLEIESTESLDHLAEDSLQNEFPKVVFSVDDFPIDVENKKKLPGKTYEIPESTVEVEDEEGEVEEVFYTNLSVNEDDFEVNNNELKFSTSKNGKLHLVWTGEVEDFTEETDELIRFEVKCSLIDKKIELREESFHEA